MKICILTNSFPAKGGKDHGGTSVYAKRLAEALLVKGDQVHVVIYGKNTGPLGNEFSAAAHVINLFYVPYLSTLLPGFIEALELASFLIKLDRREHFDFIEGGNEEGLMFFVAWLFGDRFILRLHSSLRQHIRYKKQKMTWQRFFSVWLDKVTARICPNIVTHTKYHMLEMAGEYKIPLTKISIIPHGISAQTSMSSKPCEETTKTLAYIGVLDRRKGIDIFLDAIPKILSKFPELKILIIGNDEHDSPRGSWEQWFRQTYPSIDTVKRVVFCGLVDNGEMEKIWNEISIVVVPSRYESFGYVVIESFAHGKPLLAARSGALPEVAMDGALLVEADNPSAIAGGAIELLSNPRLCQNLINRGKEIYQKYYTLECLADNLTRYYSEKQKRRV